MTPEEPRPGALVDFDGDGDVDMIVLSYLPNPPTSTMWLLANDGGGDIDAVGSNVWLNTRISGRGASSCLQTATGTPDTNGLTPTLGGMGPFHVGNPVDLRLTGAPPQRNGVIVVTIGSLSAVPFATQFTGYWVRSSMLVHLHTSGTPGMAGTGMWRLPFIVPPYVAGTTRTYEALLADPLVPGGFVRSNKLEIHYVP